MYGFGSGRSHRTSGVNAGGTSPLSDPNTLDQVIQALLDFQSQQSSAPQQTTLSRFRQLSRSLRHGSTRSAGQRSAHSSFRRPQHNVHVPHDAPGCLQTVASDSNSGLPTILESNNLLKNSGITRSLSFSVPGARNVLNSLSGAQHRLGVSAGPSGDRGRSREKSERISLTMNPEH